MVETSVTTGAGELRVLLFGGVRDVIGASSLTISMTAPLSAREVLKKICDSYPALAAYAPSVRLAVNSTYAAWDDLVSARDEVAMIPPVAGG